MNDQPAPQVPQTTPVGQNSQDKELTDAAFAVSSNTPTETPSEQPLTIATPIPSDDPATPSAPDGTENTESITSTPTPVEETPVISTPVASSPVSSTPIPQIPVNDNTVAPSEPAHLETPTENTSNVTSTPTVETPIMPTSDTPTPTPLSTETGAFGNAAPAKPESFMSKLLSIFKK
jgi:hypothetical protein